ncbi:nucleotide sugar dehydrogenase [Methanosarcina sp.]|uniref:nucleotide sugar dehydrogenase n=1 Tax=Methanosarcina sp. TaxID=2213 RepID=UPI003BB6F570
MKELVQKIKDREAVIGIIGLGYVGLPLAMAFAQKFHVVGYELNGNIINSLMEGKSHIGDVNEELQGCLNKTFFPTNNYEILEKCDFLIICVPTPLTHEKEPDLTYIKNACDTIRKILRKGHFVILESTTYPGTTEDFVKPILEQDKLISGIDFGLAYSPERIDPGSGKKVEDISKIVAGINQECTEICGMLYETIIEAGIVEVKDCKTAEAAKIFENIFRNVNIALVNEFALICEKMGIDVWNVIDAATTKPYGFMPFYPGPGVGGHCIPLDPYYMSYQAKKFGFIPRFIELSGEINEFMRFHTLNLVVNGLSKFNLKIHESRIAVIGLAYKKDISDTRESPTRKIIEEILNRGGSVSLYDPYAEFIEANGEKYTSEKTITDALINTDCAIFVTDHLEIKQMNLCELIKVMRHPVIVDCRNIFKNNPKNDIVYLGIGKDNSTYT